MNGTTMGLRILSRYLWHSIAIDKMQLCLLSIAHACLYHNPTATMGHSVHNISKPLAHRTPYTLSVICQVQLKPGFIREEHTSQACQFQSKVSISQLKLVTMPNCIPVKTLVRAMSTQMSFTEMVSDSFCRNSSVAPTHSLSGWLVSDDPTGEEAVCGVLGLAWLHVVCGFESGWTFCHIL